MIHDFDFETISCSTYAHNHHLILSSHEPLSVLAYIHIWRHLERWVSEKKKSRKMASNSNVVCESAKRESTLEIFLLLSSIDFILSNKKKKSKLYSRSIGRTICFNTNESGSGWNFSYEKNIRDESHPGLISF